MCSPALIGVGLTVASSLVGGVMQAQQYNMQGQAADRAAIQEDRSGAYASQRLADQNNRALDSMRGSYLAGGFALTGSPADVIADSAKAGSLDEQAVKYDAKSRSDNSRFEARLARFNAGSAVVGGVMSALSTGVNGYANNIDYQDRRTRLMNPYLVG